MCNSPQDSIAIAVQCPNIARKCKVGTGVHVAAIPRSVKTHRWLQDRVQVLLSVMGYSTSDEEAACHQNKCIIVVWLKDPSRGVLFHLWEMRGRFHTDISPNNLS